MNDGACRNNDFGEQDIPADTNHGAGVIFRKNNHSENRDSKTDKGILTEKEMNIDFIFKIAAIGIIVAVLSLVLSRSGREEQAMMTTLAGLIVVLLMLVQQISQLFTTIETLFGF